MIDPVQWLLDKSIVAMCEIPGISLLTIEMDLMHTLALGILQWLCATVLFELLTLERRWGASDPVAGGWHHRLGVQLKEAYNEFDKWTRDECLTHSHTCFTVAQLSMQSLNTSPEMKGEAANMLQIARWLRVVCQDYIGSQHANVRAN